MDEALVLCERPDAGNMKDLLGRIPIRTRLPLVGEEIRLKKSYFTILRVIHTPFEKHIAELHVEFGTEAHYG